MDISSCKSNKQSTFDACSEHIPAASHYALKFAFQSMKERCDKLQERLTAFEEVNTKLKTNGPNKHNNSESASIIVALEEKIDELTRQKFQLSHHTFMLANENKVLCDSISNLIEEKQILVNQVCELSSKLDDVKGTEKADSANIKDLATHLESINISQHISEEDNKDYLQSIETIKGLSSLESNSDFEMISDELKQVLNKMNEDKTALQQQHIGLRKALERIKKMYKGMKMYITYLHFLKKVGNKPVKIYSGKQLPLQKNERNHSKEFLDIECTDEIICPFCNKIFGQNSIPIELEQHFFNHIFNSSDNEHSLNSFEVIN